MVILDVSVAFTACLAPPSGQEKIFNAAQKHSKLEDSEEINLKDRYTLLKSVILGA